MRDDLDEKLVREFPNLYKDRHGSMQETCMCWGFDIGDGWFNIIYDLSTKLEALILELPEDVRSECCASQVKEKFGGLRFYMSSSNQEMNDLIDEAENLAAQTCEKCGEKGVLRKGGWIQTLCDTHADGREPYKVVSFK